MTTITATIDVEFTPRARAVMDALHHALGQQFKEDDTAPQTTLQLQPGEHYAGLVLDETGQTLHHLVLMAPRPEKALDWQAAMDWAASIGGTLPTRQEAALLYANCKDHLKPEWHWSCEEHKDDASYAWNCYFGNGLQTSHPKSYEGSAVAVRRF